jgi:hypothetical protein
VQIDAIEQRARQPTLIFGSASDVGPAFAGEAGITARNDRDSLPPPA